MNLNIITYARPMPVPASPGTPTLDACVAAVPVYGEALKAFEPQLKAAIRQYIDGTTERAGRVREAIRLMAGRDEGLPGHVLNTLISRREAERHPAIRLLGNTHCVEFADSGTEPFMLFIRRLKA